MAVLALSMNSLGVLRGSSLQASKQFHLTAPPQSGTVSTPPGRQEAHTTRHVPQERLTSPASLASLVRARDGPAHQRDIVARAVAAAAQALPLGLVAGAADAQVGVVPLDALRCLEVRAAVRRRDQADRARERRPLRVAPAPQVVDVGALTHGRKTGVAESMEMGRGTN